MCHTLFVDHTLQLSWISSEAFSLWFFQYYVFFLLLPINVVYPLIFIYVMIFLQQDYRRALTEYDEKVFLSFKLILTEVRNIYVRWFSEIVTNLTDYEWILIDCIVWRRSEEFWKIEETTQCQHHFIVLVLYHINTSNIAFFLMIYSAILQTQCGGGID